jgi:hypothetical protein
MCRAVPAPPAMPRRPAYADRNEARAASGPRRQLPLAIGAQSSVLGLRGSAGGTGLEIVGLDQRGVTGRVRHCRLPEIDSPLLLLADNVQKPGAQDGGGPLHFLGSNPVHIGNG